MFSAQNFSFASDRFSSYPDRYRSFNRRQTIPLETNVLWRIESGFVRTLTSDEDGTLTTLGFGKCGDVFGLPLIDIQPYWVECLTAVKIKRFLPRSPEDRETLAAIQFSQAQQARELLRISHCKRVESRLLKLFSWLGRSIGQKRERHYFIPLHLTHQDLADTVGTTRVTVTRLMNELQRTGRIRDTPGGYFLGNH
ncbi:MAG TPA: Crp/Fnr family transcriptional regulator [Oscillatoriales cyanobacterium M59_W2019_021]|nr:Crp/Fnr family transcriptional regulator [Oscillatoriales cyanobacterium M4454_W2019_049]HIK51694.1 Crp/Fnr family transcriptional regulator [Oscillatoriales cyanobacterium M59_W2019_021]